MSEFERTEIEKAEQIGEEMEKAISWGLDWDAFQAATGCPDGLQTRYNALQRTRSFQEPRYTGKEPAGYVRRDPRTQDLGPVENRMKKHGLDRDLTFSEFQRLTGCPDSLRQKYNTMAMEKQALQKQQKQRAAANDEFLKGFSQETGSYTRKEKEQPLCWGSH